MLLVKIHKKCTSPLGQVIEKKGGKRIFWKP